MALTIRSECELALSAGKGASLAQVAATVERLRLHYPDSRLTPQETKLLNEDWLSVLRDVPPDLLALAYKRWISGGDRNRSFWPMPGQFIETIRGELEVRRYLAGRARTTLELLDEDRS